MKDDKRHSLCNRFLRSIRKRDREKREREEETHSEDYYLNRYLKNYVNEMLNIILIIVSWIALITVLSHIEDSMQLCIAYLILCCLIVFISFVTRKKANDHKIYKGNTKEGVVK